MNLSNQLTNWYQTNKRDLPWRSETSPYLIWLSEIILQQTRVDQGLPYYLKFASELPTVYDFANAPEDKILKLWQGLGYYSRARNMHYTAKDIVSNYNGKFPDTYEGLLKLKGVGEYTAAAIASFCYNQPHPVVDGNVYRVLSRYFGIDTPIDSTEAKRQFKQLATEVLDKKSPAEHNQAIMEFGALYCTPQSPKCIECPLSKSCIAFKQNIVSELPKKTKKTKQKKLYYNYLVFLKNGRVFIRQRDDKSIWKSMYEFPFIETKKEVDIQQVIDDEIFDGLASKKPLNIDNVPIRAKHVLSHRIIHASFWKIYLNDEHFFNNSDIFEVSIDMLKNNYALPRIVDRYCIEHLEGY